MTNSKRIHSGNGIPARCRSWVEVGVILCLFFAPNLFAALPTVRTISDFYGLPLHEAAKGYPVRIEGSVLYEDSRWGLLWVGDATGVLYHPIKMGSNGLDSDEMF